MFRRLAEAFEDGSSNPHLDYVTQQNTYYNTAPNMILSGTSGLPGFDQAIQTANPTGGVQNYAVKNPNDIFMTGVSPTLTQMATQCAAGSLDDLIASKNPNADVGCGWMYTSPPTNSPYPAVSQGMAGNQKAGDSEQSQIRHRDHARAAGREASGNADRRAVNRTASLRTRRDRAF